jgi:hypothetical protein
LVSVWARIDLLQKEIVEVKLSVLNGTGKRNDLENWWY